MIECLICKEKFTAFISYGVPPKVGRCPACGAKARHRHLALHLRDILELPKSMDKHILEIGPSKVTTSHIVSPQFLGHNQYTAIDIRRLKHHDNLALPNRFIAMDVEKMTFADNTFDLVICSQVMPFIADDKAALAEMARVLKPGGQALFIHDIVGDKTLTPEELHEMDPNKFTPEYIEENGTVRFYGEDFFDLLLSCGLNGKKTSIQDLFGQQNCLDFHLNGAEYLITALR